jgi:hypothetical protein
MLHNTDTKMWIVQSSSYIIWGFNILHLFYITDYKYVCHRMFYSHCSQRLTLWYQRKNTLFFLKRKNKNE